MKPREPRSAVFQRFRGLRIYMRQSQKQRSEPTVPSHIGRDELSGLLDLAPASVNRLVRQGVLLREPGGYPVANVRRYASHVVEIERRRASATTASTTFTERKVEAIDARLRREDAELIRLGEALDALDELASEFTRSFASISRSSQLTAKQANLVSDEAERFRVNAAEIRARLISGDQRVDDDGE